MNNEPFPQIRLGSFGMFYRPGNGAIFMTTDGVQVVMAVLQFAPWNLLRLGDRYANEN